jgi:protease-4
MSQGQVPQVPEAEQADKGQAQGRRRAARGERGGLTWLWVMLAFLAGLLAPAIGCGALTFATGLGLSAFSLAAPSGGGASGLGSGPAVGVIRAEGTIAAGEAGPFESGVAAADTIVKLIEQAGEDDSIEAVVLRVDSPGGSAAASAEIHHALSELDKPVVVSMGSMAASGGYYISAPADYIYATPHTLTGSIGVISEFINVDDLLAEYGVDVVVITSGGMKDFGSPFRDMTEEERLYWQETTDEIFDVFVQVVAEGRGMDEDEVRALADGRVYTGLQALDLGLVDEIGYFDDAVDKAAELGGIEGEPRVVELQPEEDFWSALASLESHADQLQQLGDILGWMMVPRLEFRHVGP